jgi:hypothetical protein
MSPHDWIQGVLPVALVVMLLWQERLIHRADKQIIDLERQNLAAWETLHRVIVEEHDAKTDTNDR